MSEETTTPEVGSGNDNPITIDDATSAFEGMLSAPEDSKEQPTDQEEDTQEAEIEEEEVEFEAEETEEVEDEDVDVDVEVGEEEVDGEEEMAIDEKADLEKDLKEAKKVIKYLRSEINEVNLLNSKLLYTNKIFKAKNLNENQKIKVLKAFDKAETVKEAKRIFETLNENLVAKSTKSNIRESMGAASKSAGIAPRRKSTNIIPEDAMVSRFKQLAGIK